MYVIKRNGNKEPVQFDQILERLVKLSVGLEHVNPTLIAKLTIDRLVDGITTRELDKLSASACVNHITLHYEYDTFAVRILISDLYKHTVASFSGYVQLMAEVFTEEFVKLVEENAKELDSMCNSEDPRIGNMTFFGLMTLMKSYLLKSEGEISERPEYLYMRVAIAVNTEDGKVDINRVGETYEMLLNRDYIHASPTLFNAGLKCGNLSSCFLLTIKGDSMEGIYDTLTDVAKISQSCGGVGLSVSKIRANGSPIKGTMGTSNGIVPMLKVYDATAAYVDQGGQRRLSAMCIYLEPWHLDVEDFLLLKKNIGSDERRTRNLKTALWIPDLFMKRVKAGEKWTLFCPTVAPDLSTTYGKVFEDLYTKYEKDQTITRRKTVEARTIWNMITLSHLQSGMPSLLYKDRCNDHSNQKNIGVIECSNLCTEVIQYVNPGEISVCNLASIVLPTFVTSVDGELKFDYKRLGKVVQHVVRNLDNVISNTRPPVPEAIIGNTRRAMGLGIQGLADVFILLRTAFDSEVARAVNKKIAEVIYYNAIEASVDLAIERGVYIGYEGSPISKGIFQFDYTNAETTMDWEALRHRVKKYGVRNSLLIALMPTSSTSQITGVTEGIEPLTSNIFVRRPIAGEYKVLNRYLVDDLSRLGLWNEETKNRIIEDNGSIRRVEGIPDSFRQIYRTVWEISQKSVIEMARDRQAFVDQSQSMNLYVSDPDNAKLNSMLFYGWEQGLKTGVYYTHQLVGLAPIMYSISPRSSSGSSTMESEPSRCEPSVCLPCSG